MNACIVEPKVIKNNSWWICSKGVLSGFHIYWRNLDVFRLDIAIFIA